MKVKKLQKCFDSLLILQQDEIFTFQNKIYNFYTLNKRDFAWREQITPYKIFVSEVMLQQTQTARVIFKFKQWIALFPDFFALADASVDQVLSAWQGLGYNRRGLALHRSAQMIVRDFDGNLPCDMQYLQSLPGIGPNTAGSISAFAFNKPITFIETNIRTIFLHEFFQEQQNVTDQQLLHLIAQTVDVKCPRDWYWALMDYGVFLKKEYKLNNKNSKHYQRQSKFVGSRRQVRGLVIKILTQLKIVSLDHLHEIIMQKLPKNSYDLAKIVDELAAEGLIQFNQNELRI